MATTASALSQSLLGVYRDLGGEAVIPATLALAPLAPVRSPNGFFDTITAPLYYDTRQPIAQGPNAAHPNGQFTLVQVPYQIGEARLAPAWALSDTIASNLVSANPALDPLRTFMRSSREWLHTDHLLNTIAVITASSLTAVSSIDLNVRSTNILGIFQAAYRAILLNRRERANIFIVAQRVADVLDQFDQVQEFRGFAAAASTVVTAVAGTNPTGAFGRWLAANFPGVQLVVDESVQLAAATGNPEWAFAGTAGYFAVANGGSAPSAFKTLYVERGEADWAEGPTEAITGEGLFRFAVRRAAAPAQTGFVVTADSQYAPVLFDSQLIRTVPFTNAPSV